MRPRHFSDWIEEYMDYASASEAPAKMHFWTAVSVVAGALRRKCWLDETQTLYWTWTPNLYIVFVAPPGVAKKSSTANIGMKLLEEVPGINFGPDSGTWQGLIKKMQEVQEEWNLPDGERMLMSAVTVFSSELGSFIDSTNQSGQLDILTDLWDAKMGAWTKQLKSANEPEVIYNPWINLLGCCTPGWIASNLTRTFHSHGLASRIIFVYAQQKSKRVLYPGLMASDGKDAQRRKLVEDLCQIAEFAGRFVMTEKAVRWTWDWYEKHDSDPHPHLPGDMFKGYIARKPDHLHKVAMTISAARRNDMTIYQEDCEKALEWIEETERYMPMVYGKMNEDIRAVLRNEILEVLAAQKGLYDWQLFRYFSKQMSKEHFEEIVSDLLFAGYIQKQWIPGKSNYLMYVEEGG